ncbi:MAG: hypothetical protein HY369_01315 [Candidatus Aenigmarchaeota archaeon]|nr:hypothetical protein [Candidatus Aenigmarchaeota archaeon]
MWMWHYVNLLPRRQAALPDTVLVLEDGCVGLRKVGYRVQWLPFPQLVPEFQPVKAVTIGDLFPHWSVRHAAFTAARAALDRLTAVVENVYRRRLARAAPEVLYERIGAECLLHEASARSLACFREAAAVASSHAVSGLVSRAWESVDAEGVSLPFDVLPEGTRFFAGTASRCVVVVEEAPRVRTLHCNDEPFTVSLPYVVFIIEITAGEIENVRLFFLKEPLRSADQALFSTGLPNVDSAGGRVCMGNALRSQDPTTPLATRVTAAITAFWSASFVASGREFTPINGTSLTFDTWSQRSAKDPLFGLKVDWRPSGTTVRKVVGTGAGAIDPQAAVARFGKKVIAAAEQEVGKAVLEACQALPVQAQYPAVIRAALEEHLVRLVASLASVKLEPGDPEWMERELNIAAADLLKAMAALAEDGQQKGAS